MSRDDFKVQLYSIRLMFSSHIIICTFMIFQPTDTPDLETATSRMEIGEPRLSRTILDAVSHAPQKVVLHRYYGTGKQYRREVHVRIKSPAVPNSLFYVGRIMFF